MLRLIKRAILRGFQAAGYSIISTTALEDASAKETEAESKIRQTKTWAADREKVIKSKVRQTDAWAVAKEREIEAKAAETEAWAAAKEKEIEAKAAEAAQTEAWAVAKEKEIESKVRQTDVWAAVKEKEVELKVQKTEAWAAAREKEIETKVLETNEWVKKREEEIEAKAVAIRAFEGTSTVEAPERQLVPQTPRNLHARPREATPLVSIVLTAYNQQRFIREAVHGVLAQTYAPLDIVILDDASSDATGDVIAEELARHPQRRDVRFIRNEKNLGGWDNMRKGLALARGEFLIGTCGDDAMRPEMAEKMVRVWRQQDVSLVTVNVAYMDEDSRELNRCFRDPVGPFDESFETLARDGGNAVCFGAAMGMERWVIDEFGFPPEYLGCADIMLPFHAYLLKGASFIPEPLLKYRVHRGNKSLSMRAESCSGSENLLVQDQIFVSHLIHAFEMQAELDRLSRKDPARFEPVARRIRPLLAVQAAEMSRKLVRGRIALAKARSEEARRREPIPGA